MAFVKLVTHVFNKVNSCLQLIQKIIIHETFCSTTVSNIFLDVYSLIGIDSISAQTIP